MKSLKTTLFNPVCSGTSKRLLAAGLVLALGGCATWEKWCGDDEAPAAKTAQADPVVPAGKTKSTSKQAEGQQFSGYLVRYNDMKPVRTPTGGTSLRWVNPDLEKGQYHSIIIDPIGFYPKPPLLAKVSKGKMLEAVQYLAEQAKKEIGKDLKIVDKPGPGVLRWDAAITGVKGRSEDDASTKHLPASMIFTDAMPTAVPNEHGFVVYLESRLTDSQSKKLIAKSVRAGVGSKAADPNVRVSVDEIKPVLNNWVTDASIFVRESIK